MKKRRREDEMKRGDMEEGKKSREDEVNDRRKGEEGTLRMERREEGE